MEDPVLASISYNVTEKGELIVDFELKDYSSEALCSLASLISNIPTPSFSIQTMQILEEAFKEAGRNKEYLEVAEEILLCTNEITDNLISELSSIEGNNGKSEDDPVIKPTDLMS